MILNIHNSQIFAVAGYPVLHSKSPLLFNALFQKKSIPAVYTRLTSKNPEDALFLFRELNLSGMNVTAPFKEQMIGLVDRFDDAAGKIRGINVIVNRAGSLHGFNTDHAGVVNSLKKHDVTLHGKKCAVLGAGGAGRAAVYGLTKEKVEVTVVNRTFERAVETARTFQCKAEKFENLEPLLTDTDILVSALSAKVNPVEEAWLQKKHIVLDANYPVSRLCDMAETKDCIVIRGEEWLVNQALPAFTLFTGEEAPEKFLPTGFKSQKTPAVKKNISLIGFMGSGKSETGKILSERLGYTFKDTDSLIEQKEGMSIPEFFQMNGESTFRKAEEAVLQELVVEKECVLACGGGIILNPVNRQILRENSLVVWLYSSLESALTRIREGTRPLLENEDPGKKARELLNSRLPRYAEAADLVVSSEAPPDQVAERIYEEIHQTLQD